MRIKSLAVGWYGWAILLLCAGLPLCTQAQEVKDTVAVAADTLAAARDTLPVVQQDEPEDETTATSEKQVFTLKENSDAGFYPGKLGADTTLNTAVDELKKQDAYWYVHTAEKFIRDTAKQMRAQQGSGRADKNRQPLQLKQQADEEGSAGNTIAWIVIITIFTAGVIYFLVSNRINILSRGSRYYSTDSTGAVEEDLLHLPHQELLQKAYAAKDYRLATRILFLQTLKLLSDKALISYQADFTNIHYLNQLRQTPYYPSFFTITRHYEYIWYGQFAIAEPAFEKVKTDFLAMQKMIA